VSSKGGTLTQYWNSVCMLKKKRNRWKHDQELVFFRATDFARGPWPQTHILKKREPDFSIFWALCSSFWDLSPAAGAATSRLLPPPPASSSCRHNSAVHRHGDANRCFFQLRRPQRSRIRCYAITNPRFFGLLVRSLGAASAHIRCLQTLPFYSPLSKRQHSLLPGSKCMPRSRRRSCFKCHSQSRPGHRSLQHFNGYPRSVSVFFLLFAFSCT